MCFLLLCVQLTNPPEIPELDPLRFLEKIDQATAVHFLSFGGCRDEVYYTPVKSLKGGDLMRGITLPMFLTPNDPERRTMGQELRRLGLPPVATNLRNRSFSK